MGSDHTGKTITRLWWAVGMSTDNIINEKLTGSDLAGNNGHSSEA